MCSPRHSRLVTISASAPSWVFLLCFALLDCPSAPAGALATATTAAAIATAASAAHAYCGPMALLRVLAFDHEGRPIQFDTWLDDLQLYLLSDSKDSISLFDLASGAATAPPATADSATRSEWLTRDAAARLAIRNRLPLAECAHFGQHRTAQALYDAVDARYSSPTITALGRLLLPYLFPELSAFATVEDLVSHLRASDTHYRATVPTEFLDRNPPPMFITLYFIVTRLPDSLRSVRDHFLSLDPITITVDLLEEHLLAAETSAVTVGATRGTPRTPFFEGLQGYTFSLGSGSVSWRSTHSSLVLTSSCEAEIYAGAMAAQELRWLTYLLTDLGEQPRSPPVLYVENKAMISLCQEHTLEHRTKHIALQYFLARELQQRGQLRHAYVATRANSVPGDLQAKIDVQLTQVSVAETIDWLPKAPLGTCRKRPIEARWAEHLDLLVQAAL
ncbi:unnamed protein product [Closterium sp. NIES-53]